MSIERLLGRADRSVAGIDLNRVLFETREQIEGPTVGYEIVLDEMTFDDLVQCELPKLTEHFLAKRLPMLGSPGVVLTLWREDRAHLFSARRFFDAVLEILEVEENELKRRISVWRAEAGLLPDPWSLPDLARLPTGLLPGPGDS